MVKRMEAGFTLIEIILAMAVSAALIGIAFAGQSQIRARARFTDALERADTLVLNVKNQAFSTVNTNVGPTSYADTFYGKAIQFKGGASAITVFNLTTNNNGNFNLPTTDFTTALPYGVSDSDAANKNTCLIFTKVAETAQTIGYYMTPSCDNASSLTNPAAFTPTGNINVNFTDAGGHSGFITFDPSSLSVTRKFN